MKKILDWTQLQEWRESPHLKGKRVVATNGCFDVLHVGHAKYLETARTFGDVLIVGMNSDRAVSALKGKTRPINNQEDRAYLLSCLQVVDAVVVFDSTKATEFLKNVSPNVWIKGGDYTLETLDHDEVAAVKSCNGQIHVVKLIEGKSTTAILNKMAS